MSRRKSRRKRNLRLTVLFLSLCLIAIVSVYAVRVTKILGSDLVYDEIFINDVLVSGMTYDELKEYLYQNYQSDTENITFTVYIEGQDKTYSASLKDFDVRYDIESTAEKIYTVGREGSFIEKLAEITKTKDHPAVFKFDYTYSEGLIDAFADRIYQETYIEKVPSGYVIKLDEMKIELTSGNRGEKIDRDKLKEQIKRIVETAERNVKINVGIEYDPLNQINGEEIFNRIYIQSKNATGDIIGKEISIVPHSLGREADSDMLRDAVDYINSNENSFRTVDIYMVEPRITTAIYEANLFSSVLGTASTKFSTDNPNDAARGVNIDLATKVLDGTLIAPGQTFSFNGTVGPRTAERGYQKAYAYIKGEIVEDIGGGICQVSSTLYNAVLYADLKITERRNHMFIVTYVDLGLDATVDYGSQDFKFTNDTEYPVRIDGHVSEDNRVHYSIIGTKPDPTVSIKLRSVILETIPFDIVEVEDPTLSLGTRYVKFPGKVGYLVEAFKVYYRNGSILKEESLGLSRYNKFDEVVRVGTK